jgi:uncharacterized protein with FMN-binding domain
LKKKHIFRLIVFLLFILLVVVLVNRVLVNSETSLEALHDLEIENVDLTQIPDGTYDGRFSVFPVSVDVNVTVSNHQITVINIARHRTGRGAPAEIIKDRVIEAQSLDVDIVSGATYSSKIILKSIEDALKNNGR